MLFRGAFLAIFIAILAGCGYKPVPQIAQNTLGKSVFIDVKIPKTDPANAVIIKDSLTQAAIRRLGLSLDSKQNADTRITAAIGSLGFRAISFDAFGYATAYRIDLMMRYSVEQDNQPAKVFEIRSDYDFRVARQLLGARLTDSIISDTDRFNAIKSAAEQSLNELISRIATSGLQNGRAG